MDMVRAAQKLLVPVLLIVFSATFITQASEPVTLVVALTHRDPNRNIVQDYGNISWTEILAQEFRKQFPNVEIEWRYANKDQVAVALAAGVGPDIINGQGAWFTSIAMQGGLPILTH